MRLTRRVFTAIQSLFIKQSFLNSYFLFKFWKTKNQILSQNSSVQVSENDVILQNQIKLKNDVSLAGLIAFLCYMKNTFIYTNCVHYLCLIYILYYYLFKLLVKLSTNAVKFVFYSNRWVCPIGKYAAP